MTDDEAADVLGRFRVAGNAAPPESGTGRLMESVKRGARALRVKGMLVDALGAALEDHNLNCSGDESSAGCSLRDQLRDALAEARKP